ncbi:ATP-binding protein [Gordonia sp. VNQ95]|uniref:ATP-binding protein n=1 Tax=Gordonia sp. VNQ95 TaxID=3156619 RepID=UPI0032B58C33
MIPDGPMPDADVPATAPTDRGSTLADLLAAEDYWVRKTVTFLGRLLSETSETRAQGFSEFLAEHLGHRRHELVAHMLPLAPATVVAAGLVLADLIEEGRPRIGPDEDDGPPSWAHHRVGSSEYSAPADATLIFLGDNPFGDTALAIACSVNTDRPSSSLTVLVAPGHDEVARAAMSEIRRRIAERNPLRGRVLSVGQHYGALTFSVVESISAGRARVSVPESVWREIDLAVDAVTERSDALRAAGLSTSYGVLIAGRPGVGKTAVSRVVATELAGDFTILIPTATAASQALAEIYEQAATFGPSVIILDDIDLYVRRRGDGDDAGLGALLAALDGAAKSDRVLTLATTNDPRALDGAATRAARFDSIIELDAPSDAAAATIVRGLLDKVPGSDVDVERVIAAFPDGRNGADIVETVRRAILLAGAPVTTGSLLSVIDRQEYASSLPMGTYL